jgi:hypothetical protein
MDVFGINANKSTLNGLWSETERYLGRHLINATNFAIVVVVAVDVVVDNDGAVDIDVV